MRPKWIPLLALAAALAGGGCYTRLHAGGLSGDGRGAVGMGTLGFGYVAQQPEGRIAIGMTGGFAGGGGEADDSVLVGLELLGDIGLKQLGRGRRLSGLVRLHAAGTGYMKEGEASDRDSKLEGTLAEFGAGLGYDILGGDDGGAVSHMLFGVVGTAGYVDFSGQDARWGLGAMFELTAGFDLARMLDGVGEPDDD